MAEENGNPNVTFTTKEMLVRMDGKLDVLAGKQVHYDVELALLKARADEVEHRMGNREQERTAQQNKLASELETQRDRMNLAVDDIKKNQNKVERKLAYATGTVSALIVVAEILSRIWK